jgi:HEAT repeat protein|tara:strand:+ start:135 stop:647 length:513 start_codon:yes stop_codon:yes gene_type:complete
MNESKIDKTEISEHIHTKNPEIIKKIISKLDDQNIQIRGEAFYSLFLNENDISDILIDGLNSESNNIKGFSSLILANRGDSNAIPYVEQLIQDSSSMVRSYALGALAHLNAQQSINLIRKCFDDEKIEVRKNAVQAFFKIEGKIFDNEVEKLRENADEELMFLLEKHKKC